LDTKGQRQKKRGNITNKGACRELGTNKNNIINYVINHSMIIIYIKFTVIMTIIFIFKKLLYLVHNYQEKKTTWPIIISTTLNVFIQNNVINWIIMLKETV
jgi:hypothetical protein